MKTIMDCEGHVLLCQDWDLSILLEYCSLTEPKSGFSDVPLGVEEVVTCLREQWKACYDFQLVVRGERLYLQVMWAYLEQQSFPMDEETYMAHMNDVLEVVNRLGLALLVREWLASTKKRPRLGKAISLELKGSKGLDEFVL